MTGLADRRPLRVISIEDSPDFTVLARRLLEREGFDPQIERVETAEGLEAALDRQSWDLILSDHSMPGFSSTGALRIIKARDLDLPFIIVSGFIGEENAVLAMREGAHDYVPKTSLGRLGVAVQRALRDAAERAALRQRERDLEALHQVAFAAGSALDVDRLATFTVDRARELLGTDTAMLYWWDAPAGVLRSVARSPDNGSRGGELRPGVSASGVAFERREPIVIDDYQSWPQRRAGRLADYASMMATPLFVGQRVVGALSVGSDRPRHFSPSEVRVLSLLAAEVAPAIEASRLLTEVQDSELRFRTVFAANPAALTITRASDGVIIDANTAIAGLIGSERGAMIGQAIQDVGLALDPTFTERLRATLATAGTFGPVERPIRTASGERREVLAMFTRVTLHGEPCVLASHIDVTDANAARRALQRAAHYDGLTSLPNRTLFTLHLASRIASAEAGGRFAVLCLDLDDFREVNEAFGYEAGNAVLVEVGTRLAAIGSGDEGTARFAEDEFALCLADGAEEHARRAAERVLDALHAPFLVSGQSVHLGASVGIVLFPDHGSTPEVLLQRADTVMHAAKRSNARYAVYGPSLEPNSQQRIALASELRSAMAAEQLTLFYQPQVDIATGALVGAEALLRWIHPQRGMVPPMEFIPIAEQTGLINELTPWVLKRALAQARSWPGLPPTLRVAVNVATRNLRDPEFVDTVEALLRTSGVRPESLTLEITEGAILLEPQRSRAVLEAVRAMGAEVSLDDFGTGYSSLAHLGRLPVDEIKIDKSFVMALEIPGNRAIAQAVIDLGREFGIRVVAEGVKDRPTWDELAAMGCPVAQGFYLSPPVAAPAFAEWAATRPRG